MRTNDDILKWKRLVESIHRMEETDDENVKDRSSSEHEVDMAKSQLLSSVKNATRIAKHLSNDEGLEGWITSKIKTAEDSLQVVADYMDGENIREGVENIDAVDKVTLDVPLLIRMMEYAREDAHDDMDLHDAAERMIALSKEGSLTMDDYNDIIQDADELDEAKKDETDPVGVDPLTRKALIKIRARYPQAKDAMSAIIADMEHSQKKSKDKDVEHDQKLKYVQSQLEVLKKELERLRTQKQ